MALKIKRWIESALNTAEDFKTLAAVRINGVNYSRGATVQLSGELKRDMYFRKLVCYPDDYDNVIAAMEANEPFEIPINNNADPDMITGVELVGTKDGSNKDFTFPDNDVPVSDSESIYVNGQCLLRDVGYTIDQGSVTLTTAPESADYVWGNYKRS